MRVLFSSLAGSGHFHPLVPTARALQKAGHEVAFAVPASVQPMVEANGFTAFTAGLSFEEALGISPEDRQKWMDDMAAKRKMDPSFMSTQMGKMAGVFAETFARRFLTDLMALSERWRPDLLVRGSMELGGALAGEKLGIPYASIQVGGGMFDPMNPKLVTEGLNKVRAEFGMALDPELRGLFRHLHLSFMPERYFAEKLPPTTRYLRAETFDQSGKEGLPEWVSKLSKRPLVYATLGTVVNKFSQSLSTIAQGLWEEPVELIITVGRDIDPATLGPQPGHVHVERYIPQSLLLPRCDLAIMHGGYNSAMSALYAGVPSIIMPHGADQPVNARACERLGISRTVLPEALTPELVRSQVREMLADKAYRERARSVQAEALALPGVDHGVALLERLARDKALPIAA